jgi:hypothetical protein
MSKRLSALLCAILLTACFGGDTEVNLDHIQSARSGLRIAFEFVEIAEAEEAVPAAIAGTRAGLIFSRIETVLLDDPSKNGRPLTGIEADTQQLEKFIQYMSDDIQQILNRSTNREQALDRYIATLETSVQKGNSRLRGLTDEKSNLRDDERRLSRGVRDLRNELDDALKEGQGRSVSALTNELVEKTRVLAETETELIIATQLEESFSEILEPLMERLIAIKLNKRPLIQGVTIVDIPGVDGLRIIQLEDGTSRVSRRRGFFSR